MTYNLQGATRRNRPNLSPGDLVFCRVLTASKDLEPTLSCVDAAGKVSWRSAQQLAAGPSLHHSEGMKRMKREIVPRLPGGVIIAACMNL